MKRLVSMLLALAAFAAYPAEAVSSKPQQLSLTIKGGVIDVNPLGMKTLLIKK